MKTVIVVGSGAAGLSAALAAHKAGARVTVLEGSSVIGGTTALSSGASWLPNSRTSRTAGWTDSPQRTLEYLRSLGTGSTPVALLDRFIIQAPSVSNWLEQETPLRWSTIPVPDCHSELPGGTIGRSLEPQPLSITAGLPARVRAPLPWRQPVTIAEALDGRATPALIAERRRKGILAAGQALIAALLQAVHEAGITVRTNTRVLRLTQHGVEIHGQSVGGRVVLATGGFERDPVLNRTYLAYPPVQGLAGAPGARGDGLRMAIEANAALANTSGGWWCPTIHVPGDAIDGHSLHRMLFAERGRPGSIMVDTWGRRFTNESQSYHDVGRALRTAVSPTWLIFDEAHRRRYPVGPLQPGGAVPDWLHSGRTIADLAVPTGILQAFLVATVRRFNAGAKLGQDAQFGRGSHAYDLAMGDRTAEHPTLGPLEEPPFYALRVHSGLGGTSGGPQTDADGRILHASGSPIAGLYGAGNAVASPFGPSYPGTGATIGLALVFGAQAGRAAAGD
ncbi:FAD-dependent oxidoreductase [Kitasatospora purpeofusca]|uniref:FAD-dependent oxidoreductase n=1 Tax=Kitasatospora purpeofusca TaxID=67352 RepID=UPI0036B2A785